MRLLHILDLNLALLFQLPHTIAIPKVSDTLILPLRIPPEQCPDFTNMKIEVPSSIEDPATQCSWHDILQCAVSEIKCGQQCMETVQRAKTDIPPLSPQCSACLSPTTVAHCALCWGSHIPTGQAPRPYSSLPSISRDELCKTAKQIPEARCIVDGFCPSAASVDSSFPPDGNSSEDLQPSGLALIEQIIAELGSDAVGYVGVKPGAGVESSISVTATSMDGGMLGGSTSTSVSAAPVVTNHVSVVSGSPPSNTTSTTSTTSSEGRARGLCGRYYCLGG